MKRAFIDVLAREGPLKVTALFLLFRQCQVRRADTYTRRLVNQESSQVSRFFVVADFQREYCTYTFWNNNSSNLDQLRTTKALSASG
jgi:hypothetical protein